MKTENPESPDDELARLKRHIEKLTLLGNVGAFSAGHLHEVKQQLALVKTFSGLSLEMVEGLARELESQIEKNERDAQPDRLLELLENIQFNLGKISENALRAEQTLNRSQIPTGYQQSVAEPTDLHRILDEYSGLAYHASRAQNHALYLKIKKEYDTRIDLIEVVQHDMGRVFLNVFSNSCRALAQKAVQEGDDFTPTIGIRTRQLATFIEVAIQDNGTGIPEQDLPKIFDSFFTGRKDGDGAGIGLTICKQILAAHGGTILANSRLGAATEFLIRLPRGNRDNGS